MKALKIIAVLLVATFLYYKFAYPTYTYRYRMTAEVETPEGLKTGSSVVEITTKQWPEWLRGLFGGHISTTSIKGEGVAVEIDQGKTLFVLLKTVNDVDHAMYMLPYTVPMEKYDWSDPKTPEHIWNNAKTRKGIRFYGTLKNAKGDLPEKALPTMVAVVEKNGDQVDIKEINEEGDVKDIFGKDVKFKRIFIETTDEPIEYKIEKMSVWPKIKNYTLPKKNYSTRHLSGGLIKK